MGEITYTTEQKAVIDLRDTSILVAAAAGSGKTAVLVERIIQRIMDKANPIDIDRMLIVTFTTAAAAEMRERIGKAIGEALEKDPDNEHLQRQMFLVHNARISTIDSFCKSIVKEYFNVIGIDPGFKIIDEADSTLMKAEAMKEVIEEGFEKAEPDFMKLMDSYTKRNPDEIEPVVERLFASAESNPDPKEWLDGLVRQLNIDIPVDDEGNAAISDEEAAKILNDMDFMKDKCDDLKYTIKVYIKMYSNLIDEVALIPELEKVKIKMENDVEHMKIVENALEK